MGKKNIIIGIIRIIIDEKVKRTNARAASREAFAARNSKFKIATILSGESSSAAR